MNQTGNGSGGGRKEVQSLEMETKNGGDLKRRLFSFYSAKFNPVLIERAAAAAGPLFASMASYRLSNRIPPTSAAASASEAAAGLGLCAYSMGPPARSVAAACLPADR